MQNRRVWLQVLQAGQIFFALHQSRTKVWRNLHARQSWLDRLAKRPRHRQPFNGDSSAASKWGRRRLNPANCSWWKLLNQQDTYREDTRWGKAFRHKFRVPRTVFDSVLERALKEPRFSDLREPGHKKKGLPRHPLKIKLAAWFRVLAKGWDFDTAGRPRRSSAGASIRSMFAHER